MVDYKKKVEKQHQIVKKASGTKKRSTFNQ